MSDPARDDRPQNDDKPRPKGGIGAARPAKKVPMPDVGYPGHPPPPEDHELAAKADTDEATEALVEGLQRAPSEPIIIVGGGRVGRALMRKFPSGVVLETDPTKIARLRDEFGTNRVHQGSGVVKDHLEKAGLTAAIAVVAATNTDQTNYKVAYMARVSGTAKVIARIDDPEQGPRFTAIGAQPVAAPLSACINMITNLLSPERRTIGEGVIGEGAPTVGKRIQDLELPPGAIIVSILRGDHLIAPQDEERLQVGDVITILVEEKTDLTPTLSHVTGRDLTLNPLDRLYVVLNDAGSFKTAFREAFILAQYAGAEVFAVAPEGGEELITEARRLCELDEIPFDHALLPADRFEATFVELVAREDKTEGHGGLKEGIFFECVIVEPEEVGFWRRAFGRTRVDLMVKHLDHPILIARNLKPYKNILMVIDNNVRASMNVAHTIDVALVYGSDITALVPETAAGEEAYRLLRYLKRAGRIYGVEVNERFIHGNPTIEFIKEVKSGKYDMIVMDWHARSVKRDIIRRVLDYGPKSTLLLP